MESLDSWPVWYLPTGPYLIIEVISLKRFPGFDPSRFDLFRH
jgi:hypothetical protein